MLQRARINAEQQNVIANMQFKQISAQQVAQHLDNPADLVLFHAVLEWVAEPEAILAALYDALAPGGVLSLMFYNLHGLILQNLAHGNFGWLEAGMIKRKRKRCRPITRAIPSRFISGCRRAALALNAAPAFGYFMITCTISS